MSRSLKNSFVLGAVAVAALVSMPANAAATITIPGSSVVLTAGGAGTTINFNGQEDGIVALGVSSQLLLNLISQTATQFVFGYILNNTSTTGGAAGRVSTFGFNVDPNILAQNGGSVLTGTTFNGVGSGSISNGMSVEFCLTANNNCAGGGGGGVTQGNSASGSFALNFAAQNPTLTSITLTNFVDRYQSLNNTRGGSGVGIPTSPVPEPAAWMLMILGFAGVGFAMRKKNYTQTARVRFV